MVFIFRLGRYVFVPILIEWVDIESFIAFDTALSSEQRGLLLQLCWEYPQKMKQSLFPPQLNIPLSPSIVRWMEERHFDEVERFRVSKALLRRFLPTPPPLPKTERHGLLGLLKRVKKVVWRKKKCPIVSSESPVTPELQKACLAVKHLTIPTNMYILDDLIKMCGNLESLNVLEASFIQDNVLFVPNIAKYCLRLRHLKLGPSVVPEVYLMEVTHNCTQLVSLDINHSIGIHVRRVLRSAAIHCPLLTTLAYGGVSNTRNIVLNQLTFHLRATLTSLRISDISGYNVSLHNFLLVRGSALRSLSLPNIVMSQLVVSKVKLSCANLTNLDLSCRGYTNPGDLTDLLTILPQLRALNLRNVVLESVHIDAIANHCPDLTSLHIRTPSVLLDASLRKLSTLINLTELSLSDVRLSDDVVEEIALQCSCIKSLDLSSNIMLGTIAFVALKSLSHLTSLNLSGCQMLTGRHLFDLAPCVPYLTSLTVSFCRIVTDKGLIKVMQQCQLVHLGIAGCIMLTSSIGPALVLHLAHCLRWLNVREVATLQEEYALEALVRGCKRLKTVITGTAVNSSSKLYQYAEERDIELSKDDTEYAL